MGAVAKTQMQLHNHTFKYPNDTGDQLTNDG